MKTKNRKNNFSLNKSLQASSLKLHSSCSEKLYAWPQKSHINIQWGFVDFLCSQVNWRQTMFLIDPESDPGWQLKVILVRETYDLLTDSRSQIREGLWNQCINHTTTEILSFHLESHTFSFLWNILALIKAFSLFIFLPQRVICSDLPWCDAVSKKQKEKDFLLGNVSRILYLSGE